MIISSIDIGTNTVLLLIAQTDPKNNKIIPLVNEYSIPRIGKNLKESGVISSESIRKLKEVLLRYKDISIHHGSDEILASATAAFRNASNSREVINYINDETGILINIISGNTEAQYAYLGVTSSNQSSGKTIIIDIGGGSTEVIAGENDSILFSRSFNTGVVSSSEHFRNSSNFNEDIRNHYNSIFSELENSELKADTCFAIAGTPTSLAAVKLKIREFNADIVEGTVITSRDINEFIKGYSEKPEYYMNEYKNILSGREDLIIPGSLILLTIMQKLELDKIIVSTRGIRHGAIVSYLRSQG